MLFSCWAFANSYLDTSHPLCGIRFFQVLTSSTVKTRQSENTTLPLDLLDHLTHVSAPTLAHLIAILSDPALSFALDKTSLIVIDAFSTLISTAFPRSTESSNTPKKPGGMRHSSPAFLHLLTLTIQKLQIRHYASFPFSNTL